jgi:phosphatidylserine/phosphatidylglycerophosphate/cardiolipin synthase-like enzyme
VSARHFLQTATDSRNAVKELLQLVFAAELLCPSRCLWVVSPWLRDIPVIDNTTGEFLSLCPDLPRSEVRMSRVLRTLIARGTQVVIATRPDEGNSQLPDALLGAEEEGSGSIIRHERRALHAKGIVGDRFALSGSMNLTYNGLECLTEMLMLQTDAADVEQLRVQFANEYGGRA